MGRGALTILVTGIAPFIAGAGDAGYTGSQACRGCHRQIYESYAAVPMSHSMSLANQAAPLPDKPVTLFSSALDRWFQVRRQGVDVYQSEWEADADGKTVFKTLYKLEFAVGSGLNGYSYAVRRGNYLFEAPLSYYARQKKWDLSPGYELADSGFNRPLAAACLYCHSGRPRPVRYRNGLYLDPPFQELSIGCENCHGPGAAHVASHGTGKSILNPAKLPARLAEQICMYCHQGGDTRVLQPGKDYSDFRPGSWLNDTLAIFRIASRNTNTDLLEHHSAMQASKCFAGSSGKLSCFSCHDPHSRPAPADAVGWYRSKCLGCHAEANCKLPRPERDQRGNDCSACHMPKRDVTTISHSALTNHRIIARMGEPPPAPAQPEAGLIHLNKPAGGAYLPPLTLWSAYGELLDKEPALQARYLALLDEVAKSAPDNGLVQAALGVRDLRQNSPDSNASAIAHLSKALDLGFSGSRVYADLAEALARAGGQEDAVEVLKRGIAAEPYAPELYKSLALRYITLKQYPKAKETMQRYVDLFPEDNFMRGLLAKTGH